MVRLRQHDAWASPAPAWRPAWAHVTSPVSRRRPNAWQTGGVTLLSGVDTGHVVHFYDHEESLSLAVADFLGLALAEGGSVLVVATPAHSYAISRVLEGSGIDVSSARAAQRYVEVDADDLLSRFMVDGSPDPVRFEQSAGPLLRRDDIPPGPMRVYGEMVDLLWQRGNVQGAHDLEMLWNSVGAGSDFALFCGYCSTVVDGRGGEAGRAEIAKHHGAVVSDLSLDSEVEGQATRRFEPTVSAAAAARRFATASIKSWGRESLAPEVELVVSELATNAVVHTGRRFTVTLHRAGQAGVRVEVTDSSPEPAVVRESALDSLGGRGMLIVAAVSQRWGVEVLVGGKTVWAELAPRPGHG